MVLVFNVFNVFNVFAEEQQQLAGVQIKTQRKEEINVWLSLIISVCVPPDNSAPSPLCDPPSVYDMNMILW